MIATLRVQCGFSQAKLMYGIGEAQELSRLEQGSRMPEKLLADSLFQRMGKTSDVLDYTVSGEEYLLLLLREYMRFNLLEGKWEDNLPAMAMYEQGKEKEKPLHRQYIGQIRALTEYLREDDVLLCKDCLQAALEVTFPVWREESWEDYCLCTQELRLAILLAYFEGQCDECETALRLLERVKDYLERRYCLREKIKLYPQCIWVMARLYERQGDWLRMERVCAQGIQVLLEKSALSLLKELLELRIAAIRELLKAAGAEQRTAWEKVLEELEAQLESLKFVIEEFHQEKRNTRNAVQHILIHYSDDEIAINYETLRDLRLALGISQFELSDGTRSAETISRIENGKHNPSPTTFRTLSNAMGVQRKYHQGRVDTNDYALHEMVYQRNQAAFRLELEESKRILRELEAQLDMRLSLNRQYIETCKIQEQREENVISSEEAIEQLVKILQYTMPDYQGVVKRVPTRQEFIVLNQMAIFEKRRGNPERSIEICEELLAAYHKSIVEEKHHTNSIKLLYLNYGEKLECVGRLDEAEAADRRGVEITMECEQCSMIGEYMANLAYVYRKTAVPEKQAKIEPYLRHAYTLCLMTGVPRKAEIVRRCYKECCGEELV